MRASKQDLAVAFEGDGVVSRQAGWGDMNAAIENFPGGLRHRPPLPGAARRSVPVPALGLRAERPDEDQVS